MWSEVPCILSLWHVCTEPIPPCVLTFRLDCLELYSRNWLVSGQLERWFGLAVLPNSYFNYPLPRDVRRQVPSSGLLLHFTCTCKGEEDPREVVSHHKTNKQTSYLGQFPRDDQCYHYPLYFALEKKEKINM